MPFSCESHILIRIYQKHLNQYLSSVFIKNIAHKFQPDKKWCSNLMTMKAIPHDYKVIIHAFLSRTQFPAHLPKIQSSMYGTHRRSRTALLAATLSSRSTAVKKVQLQQKFCSRSVNDSKFLCKQVQRAKCVWLLLQFSGKHQCVIDAKSSYTVVWPLCDVWSLSETL